MALLEKQLPAGTTLLDLGDHTLRGFARPERIYQLLGPDLRGQFPPLRTQQALRTNLPSALTRFVGRTDALERVRESVSRSRIVTLTGSGGTGKTRLAFEVAGHLLDTFPDGVWAVELAAIADAPRVWHAIAATLGARAEGEVSPAALAEAALRDKRALVVLDNCEHVVDEVASVVQALSRALPKLHLLATSREPLGVEGELVFRVPSMTMPPSGVDATPEAVHSSEAGQLFVERACAVSPGFALTDANAAAVARICRRVDGIPLAIELAAARLTALTVEDIAKRIDDRFRLLTGGLRTAMPRQRTLRALVDWSYELLSDGERSVLDALSVFSGGFSLDAAEYVCADAGAGANALDAIERLAAKSLLIVEPGREAETRYRLLETIRQYAGEKLVDRAGIVRRRHFDYFLRLASTAAASLAGPTALEWLDRLELEHDNLRVALDWSRDAAPAEYIRLAGALWEFWAYRGHFTEGAHHLDCAVSLVPDSRDEARLEALIGAGELYFRLDRTQRAHDLLVDAIAVAQSLGHVRGEIQATIHLGFARMWFGSDDCELLVSRALQLAQSIGDRPGEALALLVLGRVMLDRNRIEDAEKLFLDSARLYEEAECVLGVGTAIQFAGHCALRRVDFAVARRRLEDALVRHRRVGNVHDAATTLRELATLDWNEQQLDAADAHSAESLRMFRALHDPNCGARSAETRADILAAKGNFAAALELANAAVATHRENALAPALARALCVVARLEWAAGNATAARQALLDGLCAFKQTTKRFNMLPAVLETVAAMRPRYPEAAQLLGCAAALRETTKVPVFPAERADFERAQEVVRQCHDAAAFARELANGRALAYDVAIDRALALLQRNATGS